MSFIPLSNPILVYFLLATISGEALVFFIQTCLKLSLLSVNTMTQFETEGGTRRAFVFSLNCTVKPLFRCDVAVY